MLTAISEYAVLVCYQCFFSRYSHHTLNCSQQN